MRWLGDLACPELLDHLHKRFFRNPGVIAVVDLHDWSSIAGPQALHLLKREKPVGSVVLSSVSQEPACLLVQLAASEEGAGDVRTHRDKPLSRRRLLEHRVEGGHGFDFGRRQPQDLGDLPHPLAGHVALLRLDQVEEREQRRSWVGIPRHQRLGFRPKLLREHGHQRSTPPITGSTLATEATTSATRPPRTISGNAGRLQKEGSRTRTRYGRTPPSETT